MMYVLIHQSLFKLSTMPSSWDIIDIIYLIACSVVIMLKAMIIWGESVGYIRDCKCQDMTLIGQKQRIVDIIHLIKKNTIGQCKQVALFRMRR